jgi:hypothetical protein
MKEDRNNETEMWQKNGNKNRNKESVKERST